MTTEPLAITLSEAHKAHLQASAISDAVIAERGYVTVAHISDWRQVAGDVHSDATLTKMLHAGGLAFPVYRLGNGTPYTWILRPELPRTNKQTGKPIKYEWPRAVAPIFDVLPRYHDALSDPAIPIFFTEGAKKADALATAYGDAIVPINLNGVWGWRGGNEKGGKAALSDFETIAWNGRRVVLAPDGDIRHNKQVRQAVMRQARLLLARYGVAEVQVLYLPDPPNGPKLGVDDYLAQGHTIEELESHLTTAGAVDASGCTAFGAHPDTGEALYLPPGYDVQHQTIIRRDPNGNERHIYSGAIFVSALGEDLATGEHTATIQWNGRGDMHGQRTIPYAALSDTKAFSTLIGSAGAALHPRNIKDVQALLVEGVQANIEALPRRQHSDRLGVVGSGLVLPAGGIGFDADVRYTGQPPVQTGTDADAYPEAIRTALRDWPDAWVFWLALGLSLAAPALARLRPRRYPVLYLAGGSGSGKTTVMQFAAGCWGAPTRAPLRIEAGRTTPAGIFQGLAQLGGLPLFIDEAHTATDTKRIENAAYQFANGQRYTTGAVDGKTRGGSELGGALLLAGEATPEFKHAGSTLRVLWIDGNLTPPLGAPAKSTPGAERARVLEQAWERGAGQLGMAVAERIWQDWPGFVGQVQTLADDPALNPLAAWSTPLAAAAAALNAAFAATGITEAPDGFVAVLIRCWAELLTSGHDDADPASESWESLVTMLAQGRKRNDAELDEHSRPGNATWEWIEADRGGGMIACRKFGDDYWRIPASTPQFKERVGASAVQLHGQAWLKRGWILPGDDGKSTAKQRMPDGATLRALKVPEKALAHWDADEAE